MDPPITACKGRGLGLPPYKPPKPEKGKKKKGKKKGKKGKKGALEPPEKPIDDGDGFRCPKGIAFSRRTGDMFVSDHHCIRRIRPAGDVEIICGHCGEAGFVDGLPADARFHTPMGMAVTNAGDELIVCDWGNHRLRRVCIVDGLQFGSVSTALGTGVAGGRDGFASFEDMPKLPFAANVSVKVGSWAEVLHTNTKAHEAFEEDQTAEGPPPLSRSIARPWCRDPSRGVPKPATICHPTAVCIDTRGNIYFTSGSGQEGNTIRQLTPGNVCMTLAGKPGTKPGHANGPASRARFSHLTGIALDRAGRILVCDQDNHEVRMLEEGLVSTVAGHTGEGESIDGPGHTTGRLEYPTDICITVDGTGYITELMSSRVRRLELVDEVVPRQGTIAMLRPFTAPGLYRPHELQPLEIEKLPSVRHAFPHRQNVIPVLLTQGVDSETPIAKFGGAHKWGITHPQTLLTTPPPGHRSMPPKFRTPSLPPKYQPKGPAPPMFAPCPTNPYPCRITTMDDEVELGQPFGIAYHPSFGLAVADSGLPLDIDPNNKPEVAAYVHTYTHTFLVSGVMPYRREFDAKPEDSVKTPKGKKKKKK